MYDGGDQEDKMKIQAEPATLAVQLSMRSSFRVQKGRRLQALTPNDDVNGANPRFRQELLSALRKAADPERARGQQAYMKSTQPFFGITIPEVRKVTRAIVRRYPFDTPVTWQATIRSVWRKAKKREERYAAVELLLHPNYLKWLTPERIDLVEELVVTGAWWDFVDAIAGTGVGAMLTAYPAETALILRRWAGDNDQWKRRTAILAQLRLKKATDPELLFGVIEPSIAHNDFFLRKGIGWALREYSKVEPETVVDYVTRNASRLSPLSKREALKVLMRKGAISTIPE